jgi:hypothetical protein
MVNIGRRRQHSSTNNNSSNNNIRSATDDDCCNNHTNNNDDGESYNHHDHHGKNSSSSFNNNDNNNNLFMNNGLLPSYLRYYMIKYRHYCHNKKFKYYARVIAVVLIVSIFIFLTMTNNSNNNDYDSYHDITNTKISIQERQEQQYPPPIRGLGGARGIEQSLQTSKIALGSEKQQQARNNNENNNNNLLRDNHHIVQKEKQHDDQNNNNNNNVIMVVDKDDYVYKRNLSNFDAAPIIIPQYKLVFFSVPKVACTTFKFLFRRMMGVKDWKNQDYSLVLPHNPKYNQLKYLWDYSPEEANRMMTSPDWTRAVFVRDPKQRLLSAFLDKAIANDGWHVVKACCHEALRCNDIEPTRKKVSELLKTCHDDYWDSRQNRIVPQWNLDVPCCQETRDCREKAQTIEGFLDTIRSCHDEHWGELINWKTLEENNVMFCVCVCACVRVCVFPGCFYKY